VLELNLSADKLVRSLLELSKSETVCLLDSGNISYLDSHLLIAGIKPTETLELSHDAPNKTLEIFDRTLADKTTANIFTVSYDFGLKLENIKRREKEFQSFLEPDIFLAIFDTLVIHDYNTEKTYIKGNESRYVEIAESLNRCSKGSNGDFPSQAKSSISSNFSKQEYISAVNEIHELIRRGDTYQTNLTQQFRVKLADDLYPQEIFGRLRKYHPAAFSAFIKRTNDWVLSISPERFAKISKGKISTSPIKGTRKRGDTTQEDELLKNDLLKSEKDLAENTMIVDLLRNDIGRVCEFGSVAVEKLCELETHPTLHHLVSTVSGKLKKDTHPSEIIKAIFPCGSITGCPKIRTMEIIDRIETPNRGLSMGAIGYCDFESNLDLSVAIRSMVIRNREAVFNVGGGIVIDSDPVSEYEESLLKAKALFKALNVELT